MLRSAAIRPAAVSALASALLLSAVGGLLTSPAAEAKAAPKPAPVRALLATNLSEAGGSRIAIRLATPAPAAVKVLVQTRAAGGSNAAAAPADFAARSQWVSINRGAKVGYYVPKIVDDAVDEQDEQIQVRILKASKWAKLPALKHRAAFATIRDNDATPAPATTTPANPAPQDTTPKSDPLPNPTPAAYVPSISVSDSHAQIIEGDAGNAIARFKVLLDAPTSAPVEVAYSLADDSAVAGADFAAIPPGTLAFAPGATELHVDVPVLDDDIDEDTEHAQLTLGAPVNATIASGVAKLSIFDDEAAPKMAITNVEANEGDLQNTTFEFEVGLSHPSSKVVTMNTYTLALNATGGINCFIPGVDYVSIGLKSFTFQPGETVKTMQVKVCGDNTVEPDEFFALPLTDLVNATTSNPQGMGRIENDDQ